VKKSGILHPGLSHVLASSGHTDYLLITDRGISVPDEPQRIDLALVDDKPTVLDVLAAIDAEWSIDRVVFTEEMALVSPQRAAELKAILPDVLVETISHIELKWLGHGAKATIRTGDTCPYANCIIVSG
jgi:D-ribose pyranase